MRAIVSSNGSRAPSSQGTNRIELIIMIRPTVIRDGQPVEDDLTRGVHPMVGRRLNLWRLRNFHVTRVEAPEDVLSALRHLPPGQSFANLQELWTAVRGTGHVESHRF